MTKSESMTGYVLRNVIRPVPSIGGHFRLFLEGRSLGTFLLAPPCPLGTPLQEREKDLLMIAYLLYYLRLDQGT